MNTRLVVLLICSVEFSLQMADTDKKDIGPSKRKFDEHELCSLIKRRDEISKQIDALDLKINDQKARKRLLDACASAAKIPNSAVLIDGDALQLALEDSTLISEGLVLVYDKLAYRWTMAKYDGQWTEWESDDDFDEASGVVYDETWELDDFLNIMHMLQHVRDDAFSASIVNSVDTGKRTISLLEADDVGLVVEKARWDRMSANFERRKRQKT
jgi:hypothetical protein